MRVRFCRVQPLFATTVRHLNSVNNTAGYWLDYGSLLGAHRDGGIIPWEFDMDMSVLEEDCDAFLGVREAMAADGLHVYARGERVPQKENKLLGYDAFMHMTCARIYDADYKYYVDLYWYKRLTYTEAQAEAAKAQATNTPFLMPPGYTESDGDLLCNLEAWEPDNSPGGCRLASWIFPLHPTTLVGQRTFLPQSPALNLEAMYGSNWQRPRPKGYKAVICGWMPTHTLGFGIMWLAMFVLLPYAAYCGGTQVLQALHGWCAQRSPRCARWIASLCCLGSQPQGIYAMLPLHSPKA